MATAETKRSWLFEPLAAAFILAMLASMALAAPRPYTVGARAPTIATIRAQSALNTPGIMIGAVSYAARNRAAGVASVITKSFLKFFIKFLYLCADRITQTAFQTFFLIRVSWSAVWRHLQSPQLISGTE